MPKVQYTPAKGLHQVTGKGISLNHLDFLAGNTANLTETGAAITDDNADTVQATRTNNNVLNATLSGSAVNTSAFNGGAAGAIFLPAADADTHLALRLANNFTGGTNALNIVTTGSAGEVARGNTAVYAKQVIAPLFNNLPEAVITDGTDSTPTANKLIFTPAQTNDFIGTNSIIHFYCQTAGQWLVRVYNVPQGNGSVGAFTTEVGD